MGAGGEVVVGTAVADNFSRVSANASKVGRVLQLLLGHPHNNPLTIYNQHNIIIPVLYLTPTHSYSSLPGASTSAARSLPPYHINPHTIYYPLGSHHY